MLSRNIVWFVVRGHLLWFNSLAVISPVVGNAISNTLDRQSMTANFAGFAGMMFSFWSM